MLPLLAVWTEDQLRVLGDLSYEGEADTITVALKKPKGGRTRISYPPLFPAAASTCCG